MRPNSELYTRGHFFSSTSGLTWGIRQLHTGETRSEDLRTTRSFFFLFHLFRRHSESCPSAKFLSNGFYSAIQTFGLISVDSRRGCDSNGNSWNRAIPFKERKALYGEYFLKGAPSTGRIPGEKNERDGLIALLRLRIGNSWIFSNLLIEICLQLQEYLLLLLLALLFFSYAERHFFIIYIF